MNKNENFSMIGIMIGVALFSIPLCFVNSCNQDKQKVVKPSINVVTPAVAPVPCPGPCKPKLPEPAAPVAPKPPCCGSVKVLAFTATWCGPCKAAKPSIAKAQERGLDIQVVDIDASPSLASKYNITSVPTFLVFQDGKESRTHDVSDISRLAN
jgi:thiol-disulfide isomerase/thioredoxin